MRAATEPLGVGLIGCGAIGTVLAQAIDDGRAGEVRLLVVYDAIFERARKLAGTLSHKPMVAKTFEELVEREDVELVIEAASQEAVRQYAMKTLQEKKDLMLMSVGALIDGKFLGELRSLAREAAVKVYIPSGAIAGLDGLKAAALGRIDEVTLTTRKTPENLRDAPYIEKRGVDIGAIEEPTLIYEGPALEACRLFPANVNVAASLSLAGVGPEKTRVRIIADPTLRKNVHEIDVKGEFGCLKVRVENVPSPDNPKTSYLAALSAIATLRKITEDIQVGT